MSSILSRHFCLVLFAVLLSPMASVAQNPVVVIPMFDEVQVQREVAVYDANDQKVGTFFGFAGGSAEMHAWTVLTETGYIFVTHWSDGGFENSGGGVQWLTQPCSGVGYIRERGSRFPGAIFNAGSGAGPVFPSYISHGAQIQQNINAPWTRVDGVCVPVGGSNNPIPTAYVVHPNNSTVTGVSFPLAVPLKIVRE